MMLSGERNRSKRFREETFLPTLGFPSVILGRPGNNAAIIPTELFSP